MEFTTNTNKPVSYKFYEPAIGEFTEVLNTFDNPDDAEYTYTISITIGIS